MIVHDLSLAQALADQVLLLKNGEVFANGLACEVFQPNILALGLDVEMVAFESANGDVRWMPKV